jgi:hypothetical protein
LRAPDQLIGNLVEIIAHEIWLWTDLRHVAAATLDQCRAPAGCLGADRIADVTGDHERIRRLRVQLARDIGIGLGRWLVTLDPVSAETTLEEIDGAAALQLLAETLQEIFDKHEEVKPRALYCATALGGVDRVRSRALSAQITPTFGPVRRIQIQR